MFNPSPPPERAPQWPFGLNKDSPQAQGLVFWFPVIPNQAGAIREFVAGVETAYNAANIGLVHDRHGRTALDFNIGAGEAINLGQLNDFGEESSSFTVSCWMQSGGSTGNLNDIINKKNNSIFRIDEASNLMRFAVSATQATIAQSVVDVKDNVPHHVVLRYDGIDVKGYIDFFNTASAAATQPGTTGDPTEIGSVGNEDILIADCRFYNTILSDAEIFHAFTPSTRWDLYWQPLEQPYFFPADPPLFRTYSLPSI